MDVVGFLTLALKDLQFNSLSIFSFPSDSWPFFRIVYLFIPEIVVEDKACFCYQLFTSCFVWNVNTDIRWCIFPWQEGICSIAKVPFRGAPCSDAAGKQKPYKWIMKQVESSLSGRMWDSKQQAPYFNYKVHDLYFKFLKLYGSAMVSAWKCSTMCGLDFAGLNKDYLSFCQVLASPTSPLIIPKKLRLNKSGRSCLSKVPASTRAASQTKQIASSKQQ